MFFSKKFLEVLSAYLLRDDVNWSIEFSSTTYRCFSLTEEGNGIDEVSSVMRGFVSLIFDLHLDFRHSHIHSEMVARQGFEP